MDIAKLVWDFFYNLTNQLVYDYICSRSLDPLACMWLWHQFDFLVVILILFFLLIFLIWVILRLVVAVVGSKRG